MTRDCPVCGDHNGRMLFRPSRSPGPVSKCATCGFVHVSRIESSEALITDGAVLAGRPEYLLESSDLNEINGSWEQPGIEEYMREVDAKRVNARQALSRITELSNGHGRLLDIGCFCGVFLAVAAENGWDCVGLEPLVMPAVFARGTYGLSVVTGTLHEDTFGAESFDVVTAFQVFEHLVDPLRELEMIKRILKPGGLLLVEVPNIDTLGVRLLGARHRHFVPDHLNFFSGPTLARFLEQQGFETATSFYPKRVLSLGHLAWWLGSARGPKLAGVLGRMVSGLHMESTTVGINLRDIVTVIARRA